MDRFPPLPGHVVYACALACMPACGDTIDAESESATDQSGESTTADTATSSESALSASDQTEQSGTTSTETSAEGPGTETGDSATDPTGQTEQSDTAPDTGDSTDTGGDVHEACALLEAAPGYSVRSLWGPERIAHSEGRLRNLVVTQDGHGLAEGPGGHAVLGISPTGETTEHLTEGWANTLDPSAQLFTSSGADLDVTIYHQNGQVRAQLPGARADDHQVMPGWFIPGSDILGLGRGGFWGPDGLFDSSVVEVHRLDADTSELLWEFDKSNGYFSATGPGGILAFHLDTAELFMLDLFDGRELWRHTLPSTTLSHAQVAHDQGSAIAASGRGPADPKHWHWLDKDGTIKSGEIEAWVSGVAIAPGGRYGAVIEAGTTPRVLHDGQIYGQWAGPGPTLRGPAIDDEGRVLVGWGATVNAGVSLLSRDGDELIRLGMGRLEETDHFQVNLVAGANIITINEPTGVSACAFEGPNQGVSN